MKTIEHSWRGKQLHQAAKPKRRGGNYETRVAAWYCVRTVLGRTAQPLYDLPAQTRLVAVHCQTGEPVDDVNAVTSDRGISFVQAKRFMKLSKGETSALGSSIDQFVRRQKRMSDRLSTLAGARSLDPQRDRLVFATLSNRSAKITVVLPRLLRGVRDRSDVHTLSEVQTSQQEREVARVLDDHIIRCWKTVNGRDPTAAEMGALLRLIWVHELDIEDGGRDWTTVVDLMRANLLVDSSGSSRLSGGHRCPAKLDGPTAPDPHARKIKRQVLKVMLGILSR